MVTLLNHSDLESFKSMVSMEVWDLYDENRNLTGKTVLRGTGIPTGYRHLSVHVWIVNAQNKFLIQKRSPNKKMFPNMWSMSGGAVIQGEDSLEGAQREVKEELGIEFDVKHAKLIHTIVRTDNFVDVWLAFCETDIYRIQKQDEEVSDVRWATLNEIEQLLQSKKFSPSVIEGLQKCLAYIKKNTDG